MGIADYLGRYWTGAEAMYGVIIVMTFTSTFRSFEFHTSELYTTVVLSALFCCVAWGVADGFFYAWEDAYNARSRHLIISDSKSKEKKSKALSMVKEELDDTILGSIEDSERKKLYEGIVEYLSKNELKKERARADFLRKLPHYLLGTSVLSAGTGVIVLLPFFIFRSNITLALNISDIIGVVALFAIGFYRTQDSSLTKKLSTGLISSLLGIIIIAITVVLGG